MRFFISVGILKVDIHVFNGESHRPVELAEA